MHQIHCVSFLIKFLFIIFTMCECDRIRSMDLKTPRNVYLTAFYKRSFAFHTVKNRMPIILTQVIDSLARSKETIGQKYGDQGQEDLKLIIGRLSELKYEVQTNKPLRPLTADASDVKFYNNYIANQTTDDGTVSFFNTIWLLSECYMYRRIKEAFELSESLQNYDPFLKQKEAAFTGAAPIMIQMGLHLTDLLNKTGEAEKTEFIELLKLNLWGNKCDLSITNGVVNNETDHLFNFTSLEPKILSDHSERIWTAASDHSQESKIISIIFDNSGYELFSDLCLADYLITKNLASEIRFYVKTIPWFISDVMTHDFNWTLNQLRNNSDENLKHLGDKWLNYVQCGKWKLIENSFWTLPVDYSVMKHVAPDLYRELSEAKLLIFKGDLNYRKLFGEKNWDPTTPVNEALQGFHPSKLCTLRTIKADIVCGLPHGLTEKIEAQNPKWMEIGDYGLIQFSDNIVKLSGVSVS